MADPPEIVRSARGSGAVVSPPGTRPFLHLQETCLRAGLIEAVAESIPSLLAMARSSEVNDRARQRAWSLLHRLARHVVPEPKASALEIDQSQHVHFPANEVLADLANDPALRAEAIRRLHAGDVAQPNGAARSVDQSQHAHLDSVSDAAKLLEDPDVLAEALRRVHGGLVNVKSLGTRSR